jgi:hypothetical protein
LPTVSGRANAPSPIGVFVPVSVIFPDTKADEATLINALKTLSRTDSVLTAARLNLIVSNGENANHLDKQAFCIANFLSPDDRVKLAEFVNGSEGHWTLFFRAQLLELIRWVCAHCEDLPGDGTTFQDAETRRVFLKAALIVGELWGSRTFDGRLTIEEDMEVARSRALPAFRLALEGAADLYNPMFSVARGRELFDNHFSKLNPDFHTDFQASTGIDYESYCGILSLIAIHYLQRTPKLVMENFGTNGLFRAEYFYGLSVELADKIDSFFAAFTIGIDELSAWMAGSLRENQGQWQDFRIIRERPFLKLSDGRMIVLDQVLFGELARVGPLFRTLPKKKKDRDARICMFGHAFACYAGAILREMYQHESSVIAQRLICPLDGIRIADNSYVEIADACLNDVFELVLFEMKSAFIADAVVEDEPRQYAQKVRERYAQEKADGMRPKGVAQLASAINNLVSKDWKSNSISLSDVKRVFSVLLTHDKHMDSDPHSQLLSGEFKAILQPDQTLPDGSMRKGNLIVMPLVVMSLDTLENLERSVEKFRLVDLLRAYSSAAPNGETSLHNFIAYSEYGKKLIGSMTIGKSALKAIDTARRLMTKNEAIDDSTSI